MAELLTIDQAAAIIRVTPAMVRRYCARGILPSNRVGPVWLILRRDAERFKRPARGRPTQERS